MTHSHKALVDVGERVRRLPLTQPIDRLGNQKHHGAIAKKVFEHGRKKGTDSTALRLQALRFTNDFVGLDEEDPCPWGVMRRMLTRRPDGTRRTHRQ